MSTHSQVASLIRKAQRALKETPIEQVQKNLYAAQNEISQILISYKQAGGSQGWSQMSQDADGKPLYTTEETQLLEVALNGLFPFLDPILSVKKKEQSNQTGGALGQQDLPKLASFLPDQKDLSIDKAYHSVQDYISNLDEQNRELARTIGPFRFINKMSIDPKIPLPLPAPPIIIPARSIVPGISTFLELLRLLVSYGPLSSSTLRNIFSGVIAIMDILRGSWKNGVLSLLGVFGSTPLLFGLFGKLLNNTWELINPDIRQRLSDDMFSGTKSAFIGGWLWLFSILSPDFVRTIVNTSMQQLRIPLEEFNNRLGALEQSAAAGSGEPIEFPRLPLNMLPDFDDIQKIQTLAAQPAIYCSPEFQSVLEPLMNLAPMRLVLELLNVPTQPEDIQQKCVGQTIPIEEKVMTAFAPRLVGQNVLPTTSNSETFQAKPSNSSVRASLENATFAHNPPRSMPMPTTVANQQKVLTGLSPIKSRRVQGGRKKRS